MEILALPNSITELLERLDSPIKLSKHLQIVYSTANEILVHVKKKWPSIVLNESLVLFGAATHDIGKIKIKNELNEVGKKHELEGNIILKELGFTDEEARFTLTHGNWKEDNIEIEDLLVSLADKVWKAKRVDELEEKVGYKISSQLKIDYWEVYVPLDNLLSKVAIGADKRIQWQSQ